MIELQRITLKRDGAIRHIKCSRYYKDSEAMNNALKYFTAKYELGSLRCVEVENGTALPNKEERRIKEALYNEYTNVNNH